MLNLDEFDFSGPRLSKGWFQIIRVVRNIGARIIDFLDQIERFQMMLWEKRKFVTDTEYCIAVGIVDAVFLPTIAECEPQWSEWNKLLHIDETSDGLFAATNDANDRRLSFLNEHPSLM